MAAKRWQVSAILTQPYLADLSTMNRRQAAQMLGGLALLALGTPSAAQDAVDGFSARTFVASGAARLPYRLFMPESAGAPLPLIVYLHGSGGAGTDNLAQITGGNMSGTHLWITPSAQARYPSFVVAPQIPVSKTWSASAFDSLSYADVVVQLIAELAQTLPVDRDRIYLLGQSLGGFGVWDLIADRPELFAAAVALCGGGNPEQIGAASRVPVWAFHGAMDQVVPVVRSREMVRALSAAGGTARYTEYPDIAHDVWTQAFAESQLLEWLFAQKRGNR